MACQTCQQNRPDADQIRRSNALVCHFCLWAEHEGGPWHGTAVRCTVSGKPIESHVASCAPSCPKGKHYRDGVVRFWFMSWIGHVFPLAFLMRGSLTGPLPGCGCNAFLKRTWLRIKRKIAGTNPEVAHGV